MTWTTPIEQLEGYTVTADDWNNQVVENLKHLLDTVEPNDLTNNSGGSVSPGDVVIIDSSADNSFTTTTTAHDPLVFGVAMETIDNAAAGRIAIMGVVTVNVQGNIARGDYLATSTTVKRAHSAETNKTASTFARALTAYSGGGAGTVTALILNKMSGEAIVSNSIFHITGTSVPGSYTEYTSARGRMVIGLPSGGTNEGTVGSALTNLQNPTHIHSYTENVSHSHTVSKGALPSTGGATLAIQGSAVVTGSITTSSAGSASADSTTGTGVVPYIQLLTIGKD